MNLSLILSLVATVLSCTETVLAKRWHREKLSQLADETYKERECLVGAGESYRGLKAVSARGHRCLPWTRFQMIGADVLGLGEHNYCRNPDKSLRPWCRVKRRTRIVRELCDIPECDPETGSPTVLPGGTSISRAPLPPQMDTEFTCGEKEERRFKVVGGNVVSIEAQPWMAAIFIDNRYQCGGSLIAPCWVLTATHCLIGDDDEVMSAQLMTVYLGRSSIVKNDSIREQKFSVEQLFVHPDYSNNEGNYKNDIGLLKLRAKHGVCALQSPSVRTVCMPPPHIMLPPGAICSVAGYGKTSQGAWQYSNDLRQAKVALLSQSVCEDREYYGKLITKNMFCAGSPDWKTDSCQGDSGGPLVCEVGGRAFVFGVVSWGDGCARNKKPGVYTRLTNYNTWISQKTRLPAYTAGLMYPQK
ncbi:urokinase-type plasminogen activator [Esox lucius]|uniref:trypsin n=1 Tax=Esox lucius TaxID=8010 RepID=A0A3P8ZTD6_ESOLU|nr:urokinase-type plasminogen activator [Esox lucius]XP_010868488.2 urokinase-type plasminogen activator [Esox lucius]XP_010868489.2 urokinase-type plasminogen activator [Esox lucius]XP_010868490.2 urokinase-type plasminogen activator [Esox lucius]